MAKTQLDRSQELVAYFVNHCDDGNLGRTRLMKLLYLADYEARRYLGRPLSDIRYVWHYYGPYDHQLPKLTKELQEKGILEENTVLYPNGKQGYQYQRGPQGVAFTFTPAEMEILGYVCRTYSQIDLRELLDDVVYQTEPMIEAQARGAKGEELDMKVVDGVKRNELGVPFEDLLERSRRVRAGEYLLHRDAMMAVSGELVNA